MSDEYDRFLPGDLVWFNEDGCWSHHWDRYPVTIIRRSKLGWYECELLKESDPGNALSNYLQLSKIQNGQAHQLNSSEDYLTSRLEDTFVFNPTTLL